MAGFLENNESEITFKGKNSQVSERIAQGVEGLDMSTAFEHSAGNRTYVANDAVSSHLLQGLGNIFQQQAQQEHRTGHGLK